MSSKVLRDTPINIIKKELIELGIPNYDHENFWEAIKENLNTREEISQLWDLCINGVYPVIEKEDLELIPLGTPMAYNVG